MEKRHCHGTNIWTSLKDEEFQEEDVWASFNVRKDSDSFKEPSVICRRLPAATRIMIPKSNTRNSIISQESEIVQHSAPVKIPADWSKIYGKKPIKTSKNAHPWHDEDEEGNVIPPHEWIARNQISSFSVCEGAGRTLKGRDLSRVRNAVLTKTGFLESKSNNQ